MNSHNCCKISEPMLVMGIMCPSCATPGLTVKTVSLKDMITFVCDSFYIYIYKYILLLVCMSLNTLSYLANHTYSHIIKYIHHICIYNSAFYPHFSVLSSFQRFIPISVFYPHFSFRPFSVSVSAIQFQRFIPTLRRHLPT